MGIRKLMKLGVVAAVSAAMFGCGGGGGKALFGGGWTKSGTAIKGYLQNATVYVECDGVRVGESTNTTENGTFTLTLNTPPGGNCTIVVEGGIDKSTNDTFTGTLLSPTDYKVVSPVTTLVAVDRTLENKLGGKDKIDIDYVNASDEEAKKVAKFAVAVGKVIDMIGDAIENSTGSEPSSDLAEKLYENIAKELASANVTTDIIEEFANTTTAEKLASTIANATKNALESYDGITLDNVTPIENALKEIANITITENTTIDHIETEAHNATSEALDSLISAVTVMTIKPTKVVFAGEPGNVTDGIFSLPGLKEYQVIDNKVLKVYVDISNATSNATYNDVSFVAEINDKTSNRRAIISLTGVKVTINNDNNGTIKEINVPNSARLRIEGYTSNNKYVYAELKNELEDVIDLCEENNCFYYDLSKVEDKLNSTDVPEALREIAYPGNYEISLEVDGFPTKIKVKGEVAVERNHAPKINVSNSTVTVEEGENATINVTISDDDGNPVTVTATSSDDNIASAFYDNGTLTITGNSEGTATITLIADDNYGGVTSTTISVIVTPHINHAPQITAVSPGNVTLEVGENETVSVTISDADYDDVTLNATSSNSSVAEVSQPSCSDITEGSGNCNCTFTVTGVAAGNATITLTANDGHGGTDSTEVSVIVEQWYEIVKDYDLSTEDYNDHKIALSLTGTLSSSNVTVETTKYPLPNDPIQDVDFTTVYIVETPGDTNNYIEFKYQNGSYSDGDEFKISVGDKTCTFTVGEIQNEGECLLK